MRTCFVGALHLFRSHVRFSRRRVTCLCRKQRGYERRTWQDIRVGDVVHLSCNEVIPADIILLHSSDESGICHIDTSNLDGENNLKQRQIVWGLRTVSDKCVCACVCVCVWSVSVSVCLCCVQASGNVFVCSRVRDISSFSGKASSSANLMTVCRLVGQ